ncbi:hypothetical protein Pst134EA_024114 [Puccinia striiformis f. sp. tritici]|uniref:hypothetical protein n=1 Tax=Puccinia striiformis f. sp. tritici TaxID=168172 RepID=UPI002007D774|nr:hypothetical protein Pst134EA_024114 [Puccinia striiformis f. sp. tritici]KAH9444529.1 hypothetical protein Pst134EB_024788 [Puccinia striiformis f. sp. tritici]KAH9453230.1 hypothetical protein Pst134EA_024114 [Puccinia striiformis f. sp. tritici]
MISQIGQCLPIFDRSEYAGHQAFSLSCLAPVLQEQQQKQLRNTMILCACSECIKNSPVDSNGQLQNGRYISSRTHLEHQVADLKKQHSFVERFSLQNQEPSYEQSESEALVLPSTSETTHDDELPAYMNTTLPGAYNFSFCTTLCDSANKYHHYFEQIWPSYFSPGCISTVASVWKHVKQLVTSYLKS